MEKASLEKIHSLLEVFERERHYKVLITLKNLVDVRRNPVCYNLPIIPRPLPSKVFDFVTADLLRLISGGASTSGGAKAEIADRRSAARSPSGPSASNSEGFGLAHPASRRGEGGSRPERLPLPSRGCRNTQIAKLSRDIKNPIETPKLPNRLATPRIVLRPNFSSPYDPSYMNSALGACGTGPSASNIYCQGY